MKRSKKILFVFIGIIIAVIVLIYITYNLFNNKIIIDDNEPCIASMYYSYMLGIDAGTEYIIKLYYSTDNTYKYEIKKSDITIAGSVHEKRYDTGEVKTKNELVNLNNEFINKTENGISLYYSSYRYLNNPNKNLNFEELVAELF